MRSGPRPSSSWRQSSYDNPATSISFVNTDQSQYLPASEIPLNVSVDQIFSLFVTLATAVHTYESLARSNLLENLVNKDLGVINLHTHYVGSGASFAVRAWKPEHPGMGLALKSAMPSDYRFTNRDEKRRLADIILELRVLIHPPLRSHQNIIELLGLAWETDSYDQLRRWPVLVLEYASGGTLSDLLQQDALTGRDKLHICHDISSGINAIHGCGIIHGDLKPQNILMVHSGSPDRPERTWTAKIGDFGGAILDAHDDLLVNLRTPSQPWNAPEWEDKLSPFGLMQTDVYSLGLVFWSIAANGNNPFIELAGCLGLAKNVANIRDHYLAIQRLKFQGRTLLSKLDTPGSKSFSHDVDANAFKHLLSLTVQPKPEERSLFAVLEYLNGIVGSVDLPATSAGNGNNQAIKSDSAILETLEEAASRPSEVDTLDPAIRKYVAKRLEYTVNSSSEKWQRASAAFTLASEALNKGEEPQTIAECLSWLIRAAELGHLFAKSLVYRFHTAFDVSIQAPFLSTVKLWVLETAQRGYPSAQEDLSLLVSHEEYAEFKMKYRTRYAGIGRNRFSACYSDDSFPIEEWDMKLSARLGRTLKPGCEAELIKMNDQGDTILHFAASAGFLATPFSWLTIRPTDINDKGQFEETPLLHACRSGHYELADILLDLGADPTIASKNGDTPLHWILSFDASKMHALAAKLVQKKANPNAPAKRYSFVSAPELDYEAGTPLHRAVQRGNLAAVRTLLALGASPVSEGGRPDQYTPLNLAALLHYPEILEALLDNLPESQPARNVFGGMSLLIPTIRGEMLHGNSLEKIARHGSLSCWRTRALACLNILLRRGAAEHLSSMPEQSIGFGSSALFIAIPYGDIRVIEHLLKQPGFEDVINAKCQINADHHPSTPLHRAISYRRIDVFELLLCNGADPTALHTDENGVELTNLYECAVSGHSSSEFAKLLISRSIQVDAGPAQYETPFACAVRNRSFELSSYLLQQGADPNVEFSRGLMFEAEYPRTLLAYLIQEQSLSTLPCLDYLFENVDKLGRYGKLGFIVSESQNTTVLHHVARIPERGRDNLACKLILLRLLAFFDPSEDQVNQCDVGGFTALYYAGYHNSTDVELLLKERVASTPPSNS